MQYINFSNFSQGILRNGTIIAVKMLSAESKQGEREFLTEIDSIANVKHPNLVELLGCCVHGPDRMLVYEFLENSSVDHALLGTLVHQLKVSNQVKRFFATHWTQLNSCNACTGAKKSVALDWKRRSAICIGTARGLAHLHEELVPHIVHRDIKASNILLDKDFKPKIGDFGLAKLFPEDITHIITKVAGTT